MDQLYHDCSDQTHSNRKKVLWELWCFPLKVMSCFMWKTSAWFLWQSKCIPFCCVVGEGTYKPLTPWLSMFDFHPCVGSWSGVSGCHYQCGCEKKWRRENRLLATCCFIFTSPNIRSDEEKLRSERKHVFAVLTSCCRHKSQLRRKTPRTQLTSTARLPGEQLLSHQCVGDHVQNMQNTAFWAVLESQISPKPTLSQKQPSWSMRINTFCLNISKAEVKFCINAMLCKQKTSNRVKICSYLWTLSPHTHLLFFTTLPCFYLCIPNPPPPPSGEFPPPSTPPFLLQTTAIIPNVCQTSYWT